MEERGKKKVNINPVFPLHQTSGEEVLTPLGKTKKCTNLSVFDGGSDHLFQEVNGLVVIQSFSPANHIA